MHIVFMEYEHRCATSQWIEDESHGSVMLNNREVCSDYIPHQKCIKGLNITYTETYCVHDRSDFSGAEYIISVVTF